MEFNKQTSTVRSSASDAIIDQGLRSYMLKVYNYMASGVLLTGFIALAFFKMAVVTSSEGQIVGLTNFGNTIYASGLKWVIMLAPLAVVFYMSFGIAKMSAAKAQTTTTCAKALLIKRINTSTAMECADIYATLKAHVKSLHPPWQLTNTAPLSNHPLD